MFGHRFSFAFGWTNVATQHQARGQTMTVMITARYTESAMTEGGIAAGLDRAIEGSAKAA
jgi:hypothetical protein